MMNFYETKQISPNFLTRDIYPLEYVFDAQVWQSVKIAYVVKILACSPRFHNFFTEQQQVL